MSYQERGYLYPKKPFDFKKSIRFLNSFTPASEEQLIKDNSIVKGVQVNNHFLIFSVTSVGSIENPKLEYKLYSNEPIDYSTQIEAEKSMNFFFSVDDDLNEFYKIGKEDKFFHPILDNLYGYHQVKFFSAFENACWAILSTRSPMNLAKSMKKKFAEHFGVYLKHENQLYLTFPEARYIKNITAKDIEEVINNKQKSEYLKNVIEFFSKESNESLAQKKYSEVYKMLLDIKGIGDWSASFILLRGLGFMEYLPENEKILNNKLNSLYKKSSKNIKDIKDNYGAYKGYWAHYIRAYESIKR